MVAEMIGTSAMHAHVNAVLSSQLRVNTVLGVVAAEYGMESILTPTRLPLDVEARTVAIRLLYDEAILSISDIGRVMGKHHATVLHHLRRKVDSTTKAMTQDCRKRVRAALPFRSRQQATTLRTLRDEARQHGLRLAR